MISNSRSYDFLIIGAGVFGACTAVELALQGYKVAIINPEPVPHPLAASTDISKIIRMEYGSDGEYMDMAISCMQAWREYNYLFKEKVFHEVGYLVLSRNTLDDAKSYEGASLQNLKKRGKEPIVLTQEDLGKNFPGFNAHSYTGGFFHAEGGYAYSGRAVALLVSQAQKLGAELIFGEEASEILKNNSRVEGVRTLSGKNLRADNTIICAGNFTPYLLPELKPFMKVTGHPVFHLKPSHPDLFVPPISTVFAADISNTGWYGFPLHPLEKVVKVANHGQGLELDPGKDPRIVTNDDKNSLRKFLEGSIPSLTQDEIVFTRRCCYTDTLDGHFWIDKHPEYDNLTIGSGGSGHGFKMGPEVGKMIAAKALGSDHQWSSRYNWRKLKADTIQEEEARSKVS